MKKTPALLSKAAAITLAAVAICQTAQAQLTPGAGFSISTYYTHTTSDALVSFDWDSSSNLYYMTTAGFPDINVWKTSGGSPTNIYANANNFAGASVVRIGNYVYFNDSDFSNHQNIYGYGPTGGAASTNLLSTTLNYALYSHGSDLFITGGSGGLHIYYSHLAADGDLINDPAISIANVPGGGSGPVTFDLQGNMYYAPGFGDLSIYKWSVQELNDAIANPSQNALTAAGHLWASYSSTFGTAAGATSMLVDGDGDLLVTLTSFSDPSNLVEFGVNANGTFDGTENVMLTNEGLLGELRTHDGNTYVSAGNQIVQIIPEPGSLALLGAALSFVILKRHRVKKAELA